MRRNQRNRAPAVQLDRVDPPRPQTADELADEYYQNFQKECPTIKPESWLWFSSRIAFFVLALFLIPLELLFDVGSDQGLTEMNKVLLRFKEEYPARKFSYTTDVKNVLEEASFWHSRFEDMLAELRDMVRNDTMTLQMVASPLAFLALYLISLKIPRERPNLREAVRYLSWLLFVFVLSIFLHAYYFCSDLESTQRVHLKHVKNYLIHQYGLPGLSTFVLPNVKCPAHIFRLSATNYALCFLVISPIITYMFKSRFLQAAVAKVSTKMKYQKNDFTDVINFSLNSVRGGCLRFRTLSEASLEKIMVSPAMCSEVNSIIRDHKKEPFPFLNIAPDHMIYISILNHISELFSVGFLAENLNMRVREAKFVFGLTREHGNLVPNQKLRVMMCSDSLLNDFMELQINKDNSRVRFRRQATEAGNSVDVFIAREERRFCGESVCFERGKICSIHVFNDGEQRDPDIGLLKINVVEDRGDEIRLNLTVVQLASHHIARDPNQEKHDEWRRMLTAVTDLDKVFIYLPLLEKPGHFPRVRTLQAMAKIAKREKLPIVNICLADTSPAQ